MGERFFPPLLPLFSVSRRLSRRLADDDGGGAAIGRGCDGKMRKHSRPSGEETRVGVGRKERSFMVTQIRTQNFPPSFAKKWALGCVNTQQVGTRNQGYVASRNSVEYRLLEHTLSGAV